MSNELQLKRGTAALTLAALKKAGEPFMVTNLPGQLRIGIDGTAAEAVVADQVKRVADEDAMVTDLTAKQGDVFVTVDNGHTFKRVTPGDGATVSLIGEWQRLGRETDVAGVVNFSALVTDIDPVVDDIGADAAAFDYTLHGHASPDTASQLTIYSNEICRLYNGTSQAWDYVGPTPVTFGAGGTSDVTPDPYTGQAVPYRAVTLADFELTGAQRFDTTTMAVADEAAMIALSGAHQGDVCVRTDTGNTYKLRTPTSTLATDWEIIAGAGAPPITTHATQVLLITAPYSLGETRILSADNDTLIAGTYQSKSTRAITLGVIGDWELISAREDIASTIATEALLLAHPYKEGDVRVLSVDSGTSKAGTYKATASQPPSGAGVLADWLSLYSAGAVADTSVVITEAALILGPYDIGDVRTLTVSNGVSLAGSFKTTAVMATAAAGLLADWQQISWDDHGVLA